MKQETSLGNTVCLIIEFFRIHLIEISQFLFFQNFRMQLCHTVYRISACNGKMCHFHLTIINDCHFTDFFLVTRIFCLDFQKESAVNLLNNLIYTRKQLRKQLDRPFFQRFCHNGMVCISAGMGGNVPRVFPGHALLVHQNTH